MDFRGEIMITAINLGNEDVFLEHGERVGQMLIEPVNKIRWEEVDTLSETERGKGGFGSTGLK